MIQYNPEQNHKYPSNVSVRGRKVWRVVLFSFVAAVLLGIVVKYKTQLIQWLLPGDAAVTAAAMEGLVTDFRDGMSAGQALTSFCREILENAAE